MGKAHYIEGTDKMAQLSLIALVLAYSSCGM